MDNTELWLSVEKTDPKYTKQFSRGGGFKGTATNATYLARKATERFGPCGIGWGVTVLDERVIEGHPFIEDGVVVGHNKVHRVHAKLWYVIGEKRGEVEQFGQTEIVGKNKHGYFTDEEAPKKSLTDAMSKCLSLLGFSADIHLGLYDDNKYVAKMHEEFAPRVNEEQAATLRDLIDAKGADLAGFLSYFGAESIDAFPADKFDPAKKMLDAKQPKQAA